MQVTSFCAIVSIMKVTHSQLSKDAKRSSCPIACVLDILGDKWTLIVVRDLFFGKTTYSEFLASEENIPTNLLAERLKRLTSAGVVERIQYQDRPKRYAYHLTEKGQDLHHVLVALVGWGNKYIPETISLKEIEKRVTIGGSDSKGDDLLK